MNQPFRKLIRIAVVLLVLVLLFNFFGYYLLRLKSQEHQEMMNMVTVSARQTMLAEQVTKVAMILSQENNKPSKKIQLELELQKQIASLVDQNKFLQHKTSSIKLSTIENSPQIEAWLKEAQPHVSNVASIASKFLSFDSTYSPLLRQTDIEQLIKSEEEFRSLMEKIAYGYVGLINADLKETSTINTGKFVVFMIAFVLVSMLVVEPLFRTNKKNFKQLQIAKNQLVQEKKYLSSILSTQTNYVIRINLDGQFTFANSAFLKTFDYSPDEILGVPIYTTIYTKDIQRCNEVADSCWADPGKIYKILLRKPVNHSDNFLWTEWEFLALQDESNEVTEIQAIGLNVTDRIEAEQEVSRKSLELEHARDQAEKASNAKSEFMANMSHELRTPMNGIIGFTDLVLTTDLQRTQREYLENVKKSAYGLLDIINDILDFSKLEAGKLLIENTSFKLDELVEDTVNMLTVKAFEKKLEMIHDFDPEIPSQFSGDPVRIRQILVNLLGNAIKFTQKGEIAVSVKKAGIPYEKDNCKYQTIRLVVSDSGIGIPEDKLKKIFESFTQVDSSTTRKYGGTGLGLTISRSLAEMMGGEMMVESELGKGSIFTLRLPLEIKDETPLISPVAKPILQRVLVVDDNHTNLELMKGLFNYFLIDCDLAHCGSEALKMIGNAKTAGESYSLIITDQHMPEMDGITLVKEIKKAATNAGSPVVLMLSSLEKNLYQHEAEKIGINKFLSKPVKLHELQETLTSIFEKEYKDTASEEVHHIEKITETASIMVVEDDPINMLLISEVMRKMGFDVIKASHGKEALEMLPLHEPLLIFMDVNMPEMDGYTATSLIRKLPEPLGNTPIIALTADAMQEDRERCIASGMNSFISKPFRLEEIEAVLKNYMIMV